MQKPRKFDLRVGIAITRDEFELVDELNVRELADAIKVDAAELEHPDLLLAIADALENPDAEYRLELVRNKRGHPRKRNGLRNLEVARFVRNIVSLGEKQEAAIAQVQEAFGISRATAMYALAEGRKLLAFVDELTELAAQTKSKKDESERFDTEHEDGSEQ